MNSTAVSSSQAIADKPTAWGEVFANGVWHNNAGFIQLLGLCPLLAVSSTMVNALGLGLATMLTLILCNLLVSLLRNVLRPEIRIPLFVLIIASVVTVIELVMEAWFHELFIILGIFIPLIVTNCAIIGRAEAFASRNRPLVAAWDGFATGLGFAIALLVLGTLRELLGHGTLMQDAHLLFGEFGDYLSVVVIPEYGGFLLAILPPGAFIMLGLLVAAVNSLNARNKNQEQFTQADTGLITDT
ncbi:MAG: electron transport complex subunit E [Xanthomonadales bacterium]|nr:electron transport complex subunit E [Xanthomonadales bacterium]